MKKGLKCALIVVLACVIVGTAFAAGPDTIVYVTKTGEKYHTGLCSFLKKSKIAITLERAVERYQPCKQCKPPVLDEEE